MKPDTTIGTIARLRKDAGYGFVRAADGRDFFFHARSVHGTYFDALAVGDLVEFVIVLGERGLRANDVRLRE